jgi:hypothetical protein
MEASGGKLDLAFDILWRFNWLPKMAHESDMEFPQSRKAHYHDEDHSQT